MKVKGVTKNSVGKCMYTSFALGCVMFSGYVGPGYSAGTQTVQYFLTRGWIGVLIGPLIVAVLNFLSTYINFETCRRYRTPNFVARVQVMWRTSFMRKFMSVFTDVLFIASTFVGMAAMNSTICSILAYLYNIPTAVTTCIFVVASVLLAVYGMKVLNATGTFLTVAIMFVLFYVGFSGFHIAWPLTQQWMAQKLSYADFGFSAVYGFYSMITIVGSCLTAANPIVPSATEQIEYKWQSLLASVVHAVLSFIGTVIFTVLFAALMPEVAEQQLPTLYAMCGLLGTSQLVINLFAVLAIACVLSTAVTYMYGISERWAPVFSSKTPGMSNFVWKVIIAVFFALISIVGNKIGLITLVTKGYTVLGVLSFPLSIFAGYILYPYHLHLDKKKGWIGEDGEWCAPGNPQDAEYVRIP